MLIYMRIGERGQVTIPKDIREQFGLGPKAEVEFRVVGGSIVLKKAPKKLNLCKVEGTL
jgi:AbrB family looped-hinge helix DNA binding protein